MFTTALVIFAAALLGQFVLRPYLQKRQAKKYKSLQNNSGNSLSSQTGVPATERLGTTQLSKPISVKQVTAQEVLLRYKNFIDPEMLEFLTNNVRTEKNLKDFVDSLDQSLREKFDKELHYQLGRISSSKHLVAMLLLSLKEKDGRNFGDGSVRPLLPAGYVQEKLEQIVRSAPAKNYRIVGGPFRGFTFYGTEIEPTGAAEQETTDEKLDVSSAAIRQVALTLSHQVLAEGFAESGYKSYSVAGGSTWIFSGTALEWVEQAKYFAPEPPRDWDRNLI